MLEYDERRVRLYRKADRESHPQAPSVFCYAKSSSLSEGAIETTHQSLICSPTPVLRLVTPLLQILLSYLLKKLKHKLGLVVHIGPKELLPGTPCVKKRHFGVNSAL